DDELDPGELARRAVFVERTKLALPGGLQDAYAAAFGGVNYIRFEGDDVAVEPLDLDDAVVAELEERMLLLPVPSAGRRSEPLIRRQTDAYHRRVDDVLAALAAMRAHAGEAKATLLRGDLGALAGVLDRTWALKRTLAPGIATPAVDDLYRHARRHGALGGKLLGAGGGGHFLVVAAPGNVPTLIDAMRREGVEPLRVSLSKRGASARREAVSPVS
ncbi:MAG: sugar kinase, partial [Actinomycetota bacterium]|nr:sugar kinase [Actinomycetota bacterium]